MATITLPVPPSANRYWRSARGRVFVSQEATAYKLEAGWTARQAGIECVSSPVIVRLDVYRPQKRGDLDNYAKILIDSLIGIAYVDDSQIVEIHARRFDDKKNPRVEVEIMEAA